MVFRSRTRTLLLAFLLLSAVGGASAWWYRTSQPDYLFKRGKEAIRSQQWERAEALADRIASRGQPDLGRLLRGEALLEQERFDAALRELQQIQDEGELRTRAASLSGRCLLGMGRIREAFRAFSYAAEKDPTDLDALRGLAAVAYDLGNLTEALEHLDRIAELNPRDPRPHRLMGLIHSNFREDALADAAYRAALQRGPGAATRGEILLELAEVSLRQTKYAAALEHLDNRSMREVEEEARAREIRAESLYGLNRREELEALLSSALREYPQSWRLLTVRGQLLLDERRPEQAIDPLKRAVGLSPAEYRPRHLLAQAYRATNHPKEAAEQDRQVKANQDRLTKIDRLSKEAMQKPWNAQVRLDLADLFEEMNNLELAGMWRKAARACGEEERAPK